MIELLVKYIRDKGYQVDVGQRHIVIRKRVQDELCSVAWWIHKDDLRPDFEEVLYYQANQKMDMIEKAIAERMQA